MEEEGKIQNVRVLNLKKEEGAISQGRWVSHRGCERLSAAFQEGDSNLSSATIGTEFC